MQRYAFCSKILEDTRAPEGGYAESHDAKGMGVPAVLISDFRFQISKRNRGWVCFVKNFIKKRSKNSRFSSGCPLIIATREDTMINNMVLSREIEWIGYEHKRNMLQVEFIVGAIYQYENVPETVYQEFLTAPSHGRFFESNIKNKYHVRKVR
jgi:hypothetical protein